MNKKKLIFLLGSASFFGFSSTIIPILCATDNVTNIHKQEETALTFSTRRGGGTVAIDRRNINLKDPNNGLVVSMIAEIPSFYINDFLIKNFIFANIDKFFTNYPDDLKNNDLDVMIEVPDYKQGIITIGYNLKRIKDQNGNVVNNESLLAKQEATISGFEPGQETKFTERSEINKNRLPSEVADSELNNLVNVNTKEYLVFKKNEAYGFNNLSNEVFKKAGEKLYYQDENPQGTKEWKTADYSQLTSTSNNEFFRIENTPFNGYDNKMTVIKDLYCVVGIPTNFEVTKAIPNNNRGELKLSISSKSGIINSSLDSKGFLIDDFKQDLIISGFERLNTSINESNKNISINNLKGGSEFQSKTPNQITDEQLKVLVHKNLDMFYNGLPEVVTLQKISMSNIRRNSREGWIAVDINLSKYYEDGNLKDDTGSYKVAPIKITGFNQQQASSIENVNFEWTNHNQKWEQKLKDEVKQKTQQVLSDSKYNLPSDFKITKFDIFDESLATKGIVIFNVTIDKYYDSDGNLTGPKTFKVQVTGFKKFQTSIPTQTKTLEYDNQNTPVDDLVSNHEEIKRFLLLQIRGEKIITGDLNNIEINNFPENMFNIQVGQPNHINKTLPVTIVFEPNIFYDAEGELIPTKKEVQIIIQCIASKVTDLKKPQFSYNEIWTNSQAPILDDPIITNEYFINAIFDARDKIFNNLPNNGIKKSDITIRSQLNIGLQDIFKGRITLTFSLSSALPQAKEFTITFQGFNTRQTSLSGPSIWPLGSHLNTSDTVKKQDLLNLIRTNGEYLKRFNNLPKNYDSNNIDIDESSIRANVTNGSVEFKIILRNVYAENNTFEATITITGYKTINITTSIKSGLINENSSIAKLLPSSITSEKYPELIQTIIDSEPPLIINLPSDSVLIKEDLEIKKVVSANDLFGSLVLNINITNNKAWKDGVRQEVMSFENVTLEGFATRKPTSLAQNNTIDDPYFNNFYATEKDFNIDMIRSYVFNNKGKFIQNFPDEIIEGDLVISNVQYGKPSLGSISFTLGLKKFYSSQNGLIVTDDTATQLTGSFTLAGFDVRKTTLKNNGNFFYEDFYWENFNEKPSLDDSRFTKKFLLNWIVREKDKLFNFAPDIVTTENIIINSFSLDGKHNNSSEYVSSVLNGRLTINFTLNNARPESQDYILHINNFTPKETMLLASSFTFGDPNIPNNLIDEEWIKNKLIEKQSEIFLNLPNDYDLAASDTLTITNLDKSVSGQITFTLKLSNVFSLQFPNQPGVLEKNVTLTGFRTEGVTTVINPENTRLNNIQKFASSMQANSFPLKEAIVNNNLISFPALDKRIEPNDIELTNISNVNDLVGSLTVNITLINSKGWVNGHIKERLDLGEVRLTGFKTREKTEFMPNESIVNPDLFGNIWVKQFGEKEIKEFIHSNQKLFFANAPKEITVDDYYIDGIHQDGTNGIVTFTLGLRKYYSSINGLLINDTASVPSFKKSFSLSGFRKNIFVTSRILFNTLEPNDNLFNRIFKNNKGYAIDWYLEGKYLEYERNILDFINDSLTTNSSDLELFENVSINGFQTKAVKVQILPLSPPENGREDLETKIIITFNEWIINGQPTTRDIEINLKLKNYKSIGSVIGNSIEESLVNIVSLIKEESDEAKIKKMKEIIVEQINEKIDILPNSLIPSRGYFTIEDEAIKKIEISFESNGTISIKNIQIYNSIKDAKIVLDNISVHPVVIKTNSWISYLFIGGLSSLFILLIIALIYLVIKRKNSNSLENRDYW